MPNLRKAGGNAAIWLIFVILLFSGCAAEQASTQGRAINEYMLTDAGFGALPVNETTPNRVALYDASGKGTFTTYIQDGNRYYVYIDTFSRTLYIGDEAAYQKYLSMQKDKNLCRSLDATNSAPFWSCFQEFQKGKKQ
jgi:hypothetical protein